MLDAVELPRHPALGAGDAEGGRAVRAHAEHRPVAEHAGRHALHHLGSGARRHDSVDVARHAVVGPELEALESARRPGRAGHGVADRRRNGPHLGQREHGRIPHCCLRRAELDLLDRGRNAIRPEREPDAAVTLEHDRRPAKLSDPLERRHPLDRQPGGDEAMAVQREGVEALAHSRAGNLDGAREVRTR